MRSKAPGETVDFLVSWAESLRTGETIASSSWAIVSGDATLGTGAYAPNNNTTETWFWLTGGTLGTATELRNTITTSATPPRTFTGLVTVTIKERELAEAD